MIAAAALLAALVAAAHLRAYVLLTPPRGRHVRGPQHRRPALTVRLLIRLSPGVST